MSKYSPTHKTIVVLEVLHKGELPDLASMVAARAHTMDKVAEVNVMSATQTDLSDKPKPKMRSYLGAPE